MSWKSYHVLPIHPAKPRAARKPTGGNRHSWTPDEIREVFQLFKKWFQAERTPGQTAIKSGIKKSKALNGNIGKIPQDIIKKKISWLRLHPPANFKELVGSNE